jgi:hypothetical protein
MLAQRIAATPTAPRPHHPPASACRAVPAPALGAHIAATGTRPAADAWSFRVGRFTETQQDFTNGVIAGLLRNGPEANAPGGIGRLTSLEKRTIDPVFPMVWQSAKDELLSLPVRA